MTGKWAGKGSRHERGYGAAWERLRKRALERDSYLCQPCLTKGRTTPAREVDHVIPKEQGGADELENTQSICRACHSEKTAREGHAARRRQDNGEGFGIPKGIKPAACPVILVCGPPGSGKTTFARCTARDTDTVIDLDDFSEAIGGQRWTGDFAVLERAIEERDRILRALHKKRDGRVLLIVTGSTPAARLAWMKALGMRARLHVMQTSAAECLRRIKADPARAHAVERQAKAIKAWR